MTGAEALLAAAQAGDVATLRALLTQENARVDARDELGNTALHLASSRGHVDVANALLEAQADIDAPNNDLETPVHMASSRGHSRIVDVLLQAGADVNQADKYAGTPLYWASFRGHVDIVPLLLQAGANVNAVSEYAGTALHGASFGGHLGIMKLLVQANADVNAPSQFGDTPLHVASSGAPIQVVEMLVQANADLSARDANGNSPLHCASRKRRPDIVRLLLSRGVDVHAHNNDGLAPLHLCITTIKKNMYGRSLPVNSDTVETFQALVAVGATWDAKCDQLMATDKALDEAPALRVCAMIWAQEIADRVPITPVPLEVVQRGPEAAKSYIQQLQNSIQTILRLKLCVVGPSKAGKTSLIKSLTTNEPSLVHPDDRTIGVDHFKLRFSIEEDGKRVIYEVTLWDFAGQNEYHVAHSLFYSKRTLYLVCIDLEAFLTAYMQAELMGNTKAQWERLMNEIVERDVLRWVRVIFTRQPDAEFVFIATKDDLLTEFPQFAREVKAFLATKLAQVDGIVQEMKTELTAQTSCNERRADMLTLHAYQKRLEKREARQRQTPRVVEDKQSKAVMETATSNLLNTFAGWGRTCVQLVSNVKTTEESAIQEDDPVLARSYDNQKTDAVFVSCIDASSVENARKVITELIATSNRSFLMPTSYTNVLNAVVEMRQAATRGGVDTRVARTFIRVDSLINTIMTAFPDIDRTTCVAILQTLQDLGDVLWYEDLGIALFQKTVILDPLLLIDFVRQVINHEHKAEMLAHAELKSLGLWASLQQQELFLAMKQVLQKFQLVHPSEDEMKWDSDLIVPAFWNSKTPASWLFGYEDVRLLASVGNNDPKKPQEQTRVHWQYHFTYEFPDTLFDHLVVSTYSPYMKRSAGPDWILYADDGVFACRAMVSRDPQTLERILHLEAVLVEGASESATTKLWGAFECLSNGIVTVLRRYPGLVTTSIALDDQLEMRDLASLFRRELNEWSRAWMPRGKSWEKYKQAVEQPGPEEDDWVLLPLDDF